MPFLPTPRFWHFSLIGGLDFWHFSYVAQIFSQRASRAHQNAEAQSYTYAARSTKHPQAQRPDKQEPKTTRSARAHTPEASSDTHCDSRRTDDAVTSATSFFPAVLDFLDTESCFWRLFGVFGFTKSLRRAHFWRFTLKRPHFGVPRRL